MLDNNSTSGRWLHRGGFSLLRNFFFGQENEVFYLVMFQIVALMSECIAQGTVLLTMCIL